MIDFSFTSLVFAAGLIAGATLDLLLLRTLLAPPFRIWPTPEPGSWQSLTFWGLFRGGMVMTFAVAVLDWNSASLLDVSRYLIGVPLFLVGFGITAFGYFNLGLGNTYCGADGLVSHGLYRFSRNPQYASSIVGLVGLALCANSYLVIVLAVLMSGAYVLMALVEEAWLEQHYGVPYRDYCSRTSRFLDAQELTQALTRAALSTPMPAPSRWAFSAR
jgi:protein-S-isoprenylcysteine O-methyltransferase Ste14